MMMIMKEQLKEQQVQIDQKYPKARADASDAVTELWIISLIWSGVNVILTEDGGPILVSVVGV